MNVYLGIDWSQLKHDLCWMNEAGAVVAQQSILHSVDGFAKLDDARQRLGIAPEACLVGIETAHSLLIAFLWARGYTQVYVLPPGMINSTRGRFRQSGAKSDTSDARIIADVAIATLWCHELGEHVLEQGQSCRRQIDPGPRRELSLFQLGLRWLKRCLDVMIDALPYFHARLSDLRLDPVVRPRSQLV